MKREKNIRKPEDARLNDIVGQGSRKPEVKKEQRAESKERSAKQKSGSQRLRAISQQPLASSELKRNSTVIHNKRLTPVIIYFSHGELAIRACDLLPFFNN